MPFKSKAQQKYLFSKLPEVAREFADKTPKKAYKKLPEHVSEKKKDEKSVKRTVLKHLKEDEYEFKKQLADDRELKKKLKKIR
jgi:hypothetical protein